MVEALLAATVLLSPQQSDTATFRDAATAVLYARARVRHVRQDSLVSSYRAKVRTRLEASAGRSRFARLTSLLAHESVAEVTWHEPNDLRVQVLGARTRAPIVGMLRGLRNDVDDDESELRQGLVMDRPWFIPRALGDSIRVMGTPDHAALHPLADGGADYYRFAITDSVTMAVPGRTVQAIQVRVEPKRFGPSLVAGDMWIDAESADVVRFRMLFLGAYVWDAPDGQTPEDSAEAREESATAEKFLSVEAEIEYALVDRRYWMPYRQFLSITVEFPWFLNAAIPARAVTSFSDYEVNTVSRPVFAVSDDDLEEDDTRQELKADAGADVSLEHSSDEERRQYGYYRAGRWRDGRWEVDVPPADTLAAYAWSEELRLAFDPVEEERFRETFAALTELGEDLPASWTGRRTLGLAWEGVSEMLRYNRVQGPSVGIGYEIDPGVTFSSLLVSARLGFADLRPTGSVTWRRDGPGGRWQVSAYRTVRESETWTGGLGFGNSMNAFFTGHDDADYFLALGAGTRYAWHVGPLRDVEIELAYERHRSMVVEASSPVADLFGDGAFQPNPAVLEGWMVRGAALRKGRWGPVSADQGVEVLAGEGVTGVRGWAAVKAAFAVGEYSGALTLRSGFARGDTIPQLLVRLGGTPTVRGYVYGERIGREFWSAQLDVAIRRSWWAPVFFVDAGDTFTADPLVGVGIGLSLLNGLVRFNLAKGIRPSGDLRFDLLFRAPR
ncbi:MAG: hypothetical protein PVF27_01600 [Gemmatimonadales bacterium]|jgi:hypothetical protein